MSDKLLVEQSMRVSKASYDPKTNVRRIRLVSSDTGEDCYGERMSLELFNDFTSRIENNTPVPEPYKSILHEKSGWDGGMPYVSISHYKSGIEGKNIPADTEKVYVDGEMLKSTAICRDTPLGLATFEALKKDLENKTAEEKVRVSIGFLDLEHRHGDFVFTRKGLASSCPMCENGDGNKVYLKGILVHNALTRVPANPRTDAEVDKSMTITTKKEDAASIVGEELAAEIEQNKSAIDDVELSDILTVKSDVEEVVTPEIIPVVEKVEVVEPVVEPIVKSALEQSFDALQAKVVELKTKSREEALKEIQPMFDLFGQAVQAEFVDQKSSIVTATIDPALAEILTGLKSTLDSVNSKIGALSAEVTILKSQVGVTSKSAPVVQEPVRRNLQIERTMELVDNAMAMKPKSIMELARASVY